MQLTDTEKAILDFERGWWKYPGAKETAVREQFGLSATLYYRKLNMLIDRHEAEAYDPLGVRRLRRLRDQRRRQRAAVAASFVDG